MLLRCTNQNIHFTHGFKLGYVYLSKSRLEKEALTWLQRESGSMRHSSMASCWACRAATQLRVWLHSSLLDPPLRFKNVHAGGKVKTAHWNVLTTQREPSSVQKKNSEHASDVALHFPGNVNKGLSAWTVYRAVNKTVHSTLFYRFRDLHVSVNSVKWKAVLYLWLDVLLFWVLRKHSVCFKINTPPWDLSMPFP